MSISTRIFDDRFELFNMKLDVWLTYLVVELILSLTPGPAVLFVTAEGFRHGALKSYAASLGIACGNLLYFILSALGLGAVLLSMDNLFLFVKGAGAIYLIGMGAMMIYHSYKYEREDASVKEPNHLTNNAFVHGFIIQVANPKAIIFFLALVPQFIDKSASLPIQFLILCITTLVAETFILMFYGWLSSKGKTMLRDSRKMRQWKEYIAGAALIIIGINLFFYSQKMG